MISVCLELRGRPVTPARSRAFARPLLMVVIGRVESRWFARPNGNRYRVRSAEAKRVPVRVMPQCLQQSSLERDGATFAGFRLALAGSQELLFQINLIPAQEPNLASSAIRWPAWTGAKITPLEIAMPRFSPDLCARP